MWPRGVITVPEPVLAWFCPTGTSTRTAPFRARTRPGSRPSGRAAATGTAVRGAAAAGAAGAGEDAGGAVAIGARVTPGPAAAAAVVGAAATALGAAVAATGTAVA